MKTFSIIIGAFLLLLAILEIYLRIKAHPKYYIQGVGNMFLSNDMQSLTDNIEEAKEYHLFDIRRFLDIRKAYSKYPFNEFRLKKIHYIKSVDMGIAKAVVKERQTKTLSEMDNMSMSDLDKLK